MIGRFEHDMSEAVDALRQEKDRSAQTVEELNVKVKTELVITPDKSR